jgi:hypothetical protein
MAFGRRKKYSRFRYRAIEDAAEANSVALGTSTGSGGGSDSVVTVVDGTADLPGFDEMVAGTFAYSNTNTTLYYTNGTGWFKVSTVNESPTVTLSVTSVTLGGKANTALITFTVSEPEGAPWYATVSNSGISNTSQGNVVFYEANNTIEVNNFANSENLWTGNVDIQVSDGINIAYARATIKVAYAAGDPRTLVPATGGFTGADTYRNWLPHYDNRSLIAFRSGSSWVHTTYNSGTTYINGTDFSPDGRYVIVGCNSNNRCQIYDRMDTTTNGQPFTGTSINPSNSNSKSSRVTMVDVSRSVDMYQPIYGGDGSITIMGGDELTRIDPTTPYTTRDGYTYTTWYLSNAWTGAAQTQQPWPSAELVNDLNYAPTQAYGCHQFNNDGTKYYLSEQNFNYMWEYDLTTAWDVGSVDTSTITRHDLSSLTHGSSTRSMWFTEDGSVLHVNFISSDSIYIYYMTTPWDLSTLTHYYQIGTSGYDNASQGWYMSPGHDKMLLQSYSSADDVTDLYWTWNYQMGAHSNPNGVDSPSGLVTIATSATTGTHGINQVRVQHLNIFGMTVNQSGNNFVFCDISTDNICQVSVTKPFDLRTANNDLYYAPSDGSTLNLYGITFGGDDDEYLFFTETNTDGVKRTSLSNPGDIRGSISTFSSASTPSGYQQLWDPGSTTVYEIRFNSAGTRMFAGLQTGIGYVDLPTAWDLNSITASSWTMWGGFWTHMGSDVSRQRGYSAATNGTSGVVGGISFNADGSVFVARYGYALYWFSLTSPWDLSTASPLADVPHYMKWAGTDYINTPILWCNDEYLYMPEYSTTNIRMYEHSGNIVNRYYAGTE